MSGKGMFSAFVFVVLLMALVSIFWTMYNVFYGSKYQTLTLEESKIDSLRLEIERFKTFCKQGLEYSSMHSLLEVADSGVAKGGRRVWICNTDQSPSVWETKRCLENLTLGYLNFYVENYTFQVPLTSYKIEEFNNVSVLVRSDEVYSGTYDEGENVSSKGARIFLESKNISMSSPVDITDKIDRERFWYLFRIIKEWSTQNFFAPIVCNCQANCGWAEEIARESVAYLNSRFDEYVNCSYTPRCCVEEGSGCCIDLPKCVFWSREDCKDACQLRCMPSLSASSPSNPFSNDNYDTYGEIECIPPNETDCYAFVSTGKKFAAGFSFTCEDRKYFIPGSGTPEPIRFNFNVFIGFHTPCPIKIDCGPYNFTSQKCEREEICGSPCFPPNTTSTD